MNKAIEQLPIFNGRKILATLQTGEWWVAVKPLCEALEVDYKQQAKNILEDGILSQLSCEHTMVAADNKLRKMTCLPERYVYGWLFSIRSESVKLLEYKRTCYDLLYNHFHGALTGRVGIITERSAIDVEMEKAKKELTESEPYQRLQNLEAQRAKLGKLLSKQIKDLDHGIIATQGTLFPANAADN